jgi:luciferase family oxidoreductase group 1
MLPNHAPLMVAERFKTLEALFPGRIDLGLGRAPGTDGVTALALRRRQDARAGDDFLERLQELILWETEGFPETTRSHGRGDALRRAAAAAVAARLERLQRRALGSIGVGFAFAHHFASYDAVAAMQSYRAGFRPSAWRETPYAILAVAVVCAESEGEAERSPPASTSTGCGVGTGSTALCRAPRRPPPTLLACRSGACRRRPVDGSSSARPTTVRERLDALVAATGCDEVMGHLAIFDHGGAASAPMACLAELTV